MSSLQSRLWDKIALLKWNGELVKTGVAIYAVGKLINETSKLFGLFWDRLKTKIFVTVEVNSKDESFRWVVDFLTAKKLGESSNNFSVESSYDNDNGNDVLNTRPKIMFTPANGFHILKYQGKYLWIHRNKDTSVTDMSNASFYETLTITYWGRNQQYAKKLLQESMEISLARDDNKTVIYMGTHDWRRFGHARVPRPLDSVILDTDISGQIQEDIKNFLNKREWYRSLGIPFRRGYLIYGHPGTGKTSFIFALAGHFKMNVCVINISDKNLDDEKLNQLLNTTPPRCFILVEDIDAAFVQRQASKSNYSSITFSGLLNALDGIAAQEGRILFMTTNHYDQLDAALIRPGRVDATFHFKLASTNQILQIFQRFYPKESIENAKKFAESIPDRTRTMAELQGFLLHFLDQPKLALENVDKFLKSTIPKRDIEPRIVKVQDSSRSNESLE